MPFPLARRAVIAVLGLTAAVGCGTSSKGLTTATAPAVVRPPAAPVTVPTTTGEVPAPPAAIASPLAIGMSATVVVTDYNTKAQDTVTATVNSVDLVKLTNSENIAKQYVVVTATVVCDSGPCPYAAPFEIHHSDGTRDMGFIGLVDDNTRLHAENLQTGEKAKGIVTFDLPKEGTLIYAPDHLTLASWKL